MSDLNARLIVKASGTSGEVPGASDLDTAEIAANLADAKLFIKDDSGTVKTIGGAVDSVNGQTGVVDLDVEDLSNVSTTTPTDGQALLWDNSAGEWIPGNVSVDEANPVITWDFGSSGSSNYKVTGPGFSAIANDPDLYVMRGQKYILDRTTSGHPMQLEDAGGTVYTGGVTGTQPFDNSSVEWIVPMDAPSELFYQCTNHSAMRGKIYVLEQGEVNVQSDWNEADTSSDAFIQNKPTLGTAAATDATDYATAAQGALADTALQSSNVGDITSTGEIEAKKFRANGTSTAGGGGTFGFLNQQEFIVSGNTNGNNVYPASFKSSPTNSTTDNSGVCGNFSHFLAQSVVNTSGSSLDTQRVFDASFNLTDTASTTYGFSSRLTTGTNDNWNIHASGTAPNYFAGNVGIGTDAPQYPLQVVGDIRLGGTDGGSDRKKWLLHESDDGSLSHLAIQSYASGSWDDKLAIFSNGKVGIGTDTPTRDLSINDTDSDAFVSITSSDTSFAGLVLGDQTSDNSCEISYSNANDYLQINTANTPQMRIDSAGNVGIGTTSPGEKLEVNGTTKATEVHIESLGDGTDDGPYLKLKNTYDGTWTDFSTAGAIEFYSSDVSGVGPDAPRASVNCYLDNTAGSSYGLRFSTTSGTTLNDVMYVTGGGSVGIGAVPDSKLTVNGTIKGSNINLDHTGDNTANRTRVVSFRFSDDAGSSFNVGTKIVGLRRSGATGQAAELQFFTNNTKRAVIRETGFMGIGEATPTEMLHVDGNGLFTGKVTSAQTLTTDADDTLVTKKYFEDNRSGANRDTEDETSSSLSIDSSENLTFSDTGTAGIFRSVTTSVAALVTFYSSQAARTADIASGRDPIDDAPTPGDGVLLEILTTGFETINVTPGVSYFLEDTTEPMYARVTNKSNGAQQVTVTLKTIILEG